MAGEPTRVRGGALRTGLRGFAAALLALATLGLGVPSDPASGAAGLTLEVAFSAGGTISVTLPDGTPVGSTNGAPTVIPAGYYTVLLSGPMGLPSGLPYFHLTGPGVNLLSNLNEGGLASDTESATFLPSSSYTWTDDAMPGSVWTFTTSAQVVGTPPATPVSPDAGPPAAGTDVVGSAIATLRGTISVVLSADGAITVRRPASGAAALPAGRYRISLSDRSPRSGLSLAEQGHAARRLSGAAFEGKRSVSVDLTAGRWTIARSPGGAASAFLVD